MHWGTKYIGLPYEEGGRGPKVFDCWGLVRWAYSQEHGIELPELPGIASASLHRIHSEIDNHLHPEWVPVDKPRDGCIVGLSRHDALHHVGIWVEADEGKIVHSYSGRQTSVAESLRSLRMKGFLHVLFYRHALWPTS